MTYTHLRVAPHDAVFDGWFVSGVRIHGAPILLGCVASLEEAEQLAERHRAPLLVDAQVREQMQIRYRVAAAWRAA